MATQTVKLHGKMFRIKEGALTAQAHRAGKTLSEFEASTQGKSKKTIARINLAKMFKKANAQRHAAAERK